MPVLHLRSFTTARKVKKFGSGPSCIGVGTKVLEETVNSSVVVLVTGMCELDVACRSAVDFGVD